jgi:hypothetical protein
MDGQRFDDLTRACASNYSRRRAAKILLGGAVGGTLGLLGRGATAHHNPDHCRDIGATCNRNQPCCPSASPCIEHVCLPAGNDEQRCVARPLPVNTACPGDGNRCTADLCDGNGACVHPLAVTCDPPDQCLGPGTCNPATGACDYESLANGTSCDSGNRCTNGDSCQTGVCVPGPERPCAVGHVCNEVRCNPASGVCNLLIPIANGTSCQSNDLCRPNGSCQAGECVPGAPIGCEQLDDCHDPGVCDPLTGACSNPAKQDGVFCPLADQCYQVTTCQAGECVGEMRLQCQTDNPCLAGACDPVSGLCEYISVLSGTTCSTGNPCTIGACDGAGTCVPTPSNEGGTCNGGGVCVGGSCCVRTTCQAQGATCGTISDGCDGMLDCGCCPQGCNGRCGTMVPNGCGGTINCGTCGGGCFVAGTRISMADGTSKPIELVEVGDRVLGRDGRVNRVLDLARPFLGNRPLFALNGNSPFVTAGHPFLTTAGWKAVDPAAAAKDVPGLPVGRLAVGDRLLALVPAAVPVLVGGPNIEDGAEVRPALVRLERLDGRTTDPATPLFNLRVDGDHTYFANDLLVHNKEGGG